jgi:sigma54-dependent transcription regulator
MCVRGNIHVDVRLIAATHRDLLLMIRNKQFREDLFYNRRSFIKGSATFGSALALARGT